MKIISLMQEERDFLSRFSTGKNIHKKKEVLKKYDVLIKQKNTEQSSRIFCDRIEYHLNHLMFYNKKQLVFKVWLKKDYKNIKHALKDVNITAIPNPGERK